MNLKDNTAHLLLICIRAQQAVNVLTLANDGHIFFPINSSTAFPRRFSVLSKDDRTVKYQPYRKPSFFL